MPIRNQVIKNDYLIEFTSDEQQNLNRCDGEDKNVLSATFFVFECVILILLFNDKVIVF